MTALWKGDYARAYTLCAPELQSELAGQAGLAKVVQRYQPME
jgi:hypothetical protein